MARALEGGFLPIVTLSAMIASAIAGLTVANEDVLGAVLVALGGVLALGPIGFRIAQGRWDPFEPIVLFCISWFFVFFLRPLWMWINDDWLFLTFDGRDGFEGAILIGVIGLAFVLAGYWISAGTRFAARLPAVPDRWDPGRLMLFAVLCLAAAAVLFTFHLGSEGGGIQGFIDTFSGRSGSDVGRNLGPGRERASSSYFALAPMMAIPVALMMIEAWRRRRSLATASLALVGLAATVAMTVPRGERTFLLALVVPLIVVPYLLRNRRPGLLALVLLLVVTLIAANVLREHRRKESRTESLPTRVVDAVSDPIGQIDDFIIGIDTQMFPILAAQYEAMPERLGYMPGQQVTSIVAGPVPRLIWPDKPQAPSSDVYVELFRNSGVLSFQGFAVSMFGGFYADGWFIGVIIYSLLFGIAMRALFEYLRLHRDNRSAIVVFAALLPMPIIALRTSVTLAMVGVVILIGPMLVGFWWAARQPRGRGRAAERATDHAIPAGA